MSSDTWNEIQELRTKQSSFREKLLKRRKANEGLVADLTGSSSKSSISSVASGDAKDGKAEPVLSDVRAASPALVREDVPANGGDSPLSGAPGTVPPRVEETTAPDSAVSTPSEPSPTPVPTAPLIPAPWTLAGAHPPTVGPDPAIEKQLLELLADDTLEMPLEIGAVLTSLASDGRDVHRDGIADLLQKFAAQGLVSLSTKVEKSNKFLVIESTDHSKIASMLEVESGRKRKKDVSKAIPDVLAKKSRKDTSSGGDSVESLLSMQSTRERETRKATDEIQNLLSATTAKEKSLVEKFRSVGGPQVMEFCQHGTKEDCAKCMGPGQCKRLHFRKIINKHTDESLGDCSFLNTCFHMDTCKYVHYEIEKRETQQQNLQLSLLRPLEAKSSHSQTTLYPNQWIQCDLRDFDMSVLGKCAVVMADPPWDIHMELPYGTMGDDEMRALDVPSLQDDGYCFLWVTGRAMELGRECLKIWGYERVDELIWVKTNQLQRIIRTGRTGHWLNHGKEHCLIGVKGNPRGFNRGLDADVIVAEVRATSHKPDEVYGIIERLAPGMRKVELFGRPHNVQPNWITLGNQLDGVKLLDPEIVRRFKERYPSGNCMPQKR